LSEFGFIVDLRIKKLEIMIKEVSGDILLSGAEAIAHGVAPFDHFENGLAYSLKEEWPSMVKDFKHYCHLYNPEPGSAWVWSGVGRKRIFNLMTQEAPKGEKHSGHPGKATVSNVNHSLKELAKMIKAENIRSIAIPKLSTGVGGLDWSEVKPLIENHLGNCGAEVFLYSTYAKGVKGAE
jgi:O-acetyl-ADP-ribose deacetylase (regulator of RNase III)